MLGPAFVAAIAYVDPGNFATNVQGGAKFGYLLLWVVLAANAMAMLIQYLSAKLGIVTDRDLPELCREHYPRPVAWGLWVQAEVMAMSTDIAEFLGAALGLNLLFHVPLVIAGVMTGFIAFGILELQRHGFRRFELAITALLGIIFLGFLYETLKIGPSASGSVRGLLPGLHGSSVALPRRRHHRRDRHAARDLPPLRPHQGPHARPRRRRTRPRPALRAHRRDRRAQPRRPRQHGHARRRRQALPRPARLQRPSSTIQQAHAGFGHLVGGTAALAFAVALLASGASSSSVGTYAGQVVMAGFVNLRIPLLLRRAITMIPAIVVLALGVSPTSALVLSQVVLSFGIPFALIPLVLLTRRRDVMGIHVNRHATTTIAIAIAALIAALNVFLLAQTFGLV